MDGRLATSTSALGIGHCGCGGITSGSAIMVVVLIVLLMIIHVLALSVGCICTVMDLLMLLLLMVLLGRLSTTAVQRTLAIIRTGSHGSSREQCSILWPHHVQDVVVVLAGQVALEISVHANVRIRISVEILLQHFILDALVDLFGIQVLHHILLATL